MRQATCAFQIASSPNPMPGPNAQARGRNRAHCVPTETASTVRELPAPRCAFCSTADTHSINPHVYKSLPYDALKGFEPISLVGVVNFLLIARPNLEQSDLQALVAAAKQNPGKLNFSSPSTGTPHQLAMELFKQTVGIDITHVPYKGTAGAITDLVGGRVETAFFPVHTVSELARAGKLRMIASVGSKRTPWTPNRRSRASCA